MVNLLKEGGNNYDLDMDALLKKSMDSAVEDADQPKKEDKAKKNSKKGVSEEPLKASELDPEKMSVDKQEGILSREQMSKRVANGESTVSDSGTAKGDQKQEDDEALATSEESSGDLASERDECAEYKAQFFEDRPLTEKFIVVRVNDDLAQKIRVMLWRYPDLSTSSYVNNILQHHFSEFRTVLETMAREVSESVIEVML